MTRIKIAAAILASSAFIAGVAFADGRPPTAEETSAISAALTKARLLEMGQNRIR